MKKLTLRSSVGANVFFVLAFLVCIAIKLNANDSPPNVAANPLKSKDAVSFDPFNKTNHRFATMISDTINYQDAIQFINRFRSNSAGDPYRARHFFLTSNVIDYYYTLIHAPSSQLDGVRVYLGDYTREVYNPTDPAHPYPANTRSIILVATKKDGTVHRDWYLTNNRNGGGFIYDYCDPCPPAKDCDEGADLGNQPNQS